MKKFIPDPDSPSGYSDRSVRREGDREGLAPPHAVDHRTPPSDHTTIDTTIINGHIVCSTNRRALRAHTSRPSWRGCGAIKAGIPSDPFDDEPEERITRIEDLVPGIRPDDFFLIIEGDSMIDAGLQPGQYVVIRPEMPQRNGEICAVWVEGNGATLKKVYFDHDLIRLVPANPDYPVQIYPAEDVRIQGVLVAALAIRNFRR
jgi:SOS-response transcriptional repressor LexA